MVTEFKFRLTGAIIWLTWFRELLRIVAVAEKLLPTNWPWEFHRVPGIVRLLRTGPTNSEVTTIVLKFREFANRLSPPREIELVCAWKEFVDPISP
jgi:hypothetical protein